MVKCEECKKEIPKEKGKINTPSGYLCIDCWCELMGHEIEKCPIVDSYGD